MLDSYIEAPSQIVKFALFPLTLARTLASK